MGEWVISNKKLIYRDFVPGDEFLLSAFIKKVFLEFVASEFSEDNSYVFLKSQEPEVISCRLKFGDRFIIVAEDTEKSTQVKPGASPDIVGVIEVKNYSHISLLFTKKKRQRQGIAKKLLAKAIKKCLEVNPGLTLITLNSTKYAKPIYEKLGFKETAEKFDGLTPNSTSMVLNLK